MARTKQTAMKQTAKKSIDTSRSISQAFSSKRKSTSSVLKKRIVRKKGLKKFWFEEYFEHSYASKDFLSCNGKILIFTVSFAFCHHHTNMYTVAVKSEIIREEFLWKYFSLIQAPWPYERSRNTRRRKTCWSLARPSFVWWSRLQWSTWTTSVSNRTQLCVSK